MCACGELIDTVTIRKWREKKLRKKGGEATRTDKDKDRAAGSRLMTTYDERQ